MSAVRQEVLNYINCLPDTKLAALVPILNELVNNTVMVETNLTENEKNIVAKGREQYKNGGFISLDSII